MCVMLIVKMEVNVLLAAVCMSVNMKIRAGTKHHIQQPRSKEDDH